METFDLPPRDRVTAEEVLAVFAAAAGLRGVVAGRTERSRFYTDDDMPRQGGAVEIVWDVTVGPLAIAWRSDRSSWSGDTDEWACADLAGRGPVRFTHARGSPVTVACDLAMADRLRSLWEARLAPLSWATEATSAETAEAPSAARPAPSDRTERWMDRLTFGRQTLEKEVTLDRAGVEVIEEGRSKRWSVADAFHEPAALGLRDHAVLVAVTQALAERCAPEDLASPPDRARLAFWRAFDPARLVPETWTYTWAAHPQESQRTYALRLDADGLHGPANLGGTIACETPDLTFVHGPPSPAAPHALRSALRARLLAALRPGHGLEDFAFPLLDHARMTHTAWTWGERQDGSSFLELGPGYVRAGYDHGHDAGSDTWGAERVLSGDPRIWLGAPPNLAEALMARLRASR